MIRRDVQCLRGIAIGFVLLFHLFPSVFPYGFLGVDMFFVLSGYLMACTLTRKDISSVWDIFDFYYRRFKRILPLYHLTIILTVVLFQLFLGEFYWEANRRYSIAALCMVTNQLIIHDSADYFNQFLSDGSSRNVFIHTWSLSVEIQFYLIVPFIFFAIQHLNGNLLKLTAAILTSIIGFLPFPFVNQPFAFNFMFLRLWQFSAGFVALFWTKQTFRQPEKTGKPESLLGREDLVTTALITIGICLMSAKMNISVIRPLITISTAVIIAAKSRENMILKSSILSYLGDISYVLYLIHWPIICLYSGSQPENQVFCIVATLLISTFLHHLFERFYLKLDKGPLIYLVVLLLLSNILLQYTTRNHAFWTTRLPASLQKIVDDNRQFVIDQSRTGQQWFSETCEDRADEEFRSKRMPFFANCEFEPGHGNLSVAVTGNSYSITMMDSIHKHFHRNYSQFRYVGILGNTGLYLENGPLSATKEIIRKMKPDVLFVVSRYSSLMYDEIQDNDDIIRQMNDNVEFYQKYAKKIFILGPHPLYSGNFLSNFVHYAINRPNELETLQMDKITTDNYMRNARKRFKQMDCPKCHVFDLSQPFLQSEKYLTYDRETMLSYVDNSIHISAHGLRLLEPVFRSVVEQAMRS